MTHLPARRLLAFAALLLGLAGVASALPDAPATAPASAKPAKAAAKPAAPKPPAPTFDQIVAEGEAFKPLDDKGWKPTHQDDSYASHTYGGMWSTHGGLLGAPASAVGSVATQSVVVTAAGDYRVWSKYQAPPYFNYLHQVDVVQNGKTVFTHVYGKRGTPRLWSFGARSTELWWYWGSDHDTAESPDEARAKLEVGNAEIRITAVANPAPAGDRFVDFILLTTNPADAPTRGTPATLFAIDALQAAHLYIRFQNSTAEPAEIAWLRKGHYQPGGYAGGKGKLPGAPVPPGQWSPWVDIGPNLRLLHNEGVWLTLPDATVVPVQFARDAEGKELVGDMKVVNGEAVNVPIDITWNKAARVMPSRDLAAQVVALCKKWRTVNGGKKPAEIAYFGSFLGGQDWLMALKDALGYNTGLPDPYTHLEVDGYHQHAKTPAGIEGLAQNMDDKSRARMNTISFGDEITIGRIDFADPAMQTAFTAWLKEHGITEADLGLPIDKALLTDHDANPHVGWYANLFSDEQRFAHFREMTQLARKLFGPQVQTGANYSPHGQPQYYGALNQWVDIFRHNGMTMYWAEDYIFSVPQVPQMISWMFATMHCATKYNHQLIHFYVMPHAPGQTPENLRRSMVFAVGSGAAHIDSFWVGPQELWTENFVSWGYNDIFRVLHESIFDSGEVEKISRHGVRRVGRVGVVLSRATAFNEARVKVDAAKDPFVALCANAMTPRKAKDGTELPPITAQILCRLEQQMLFLALKHAGHNPELITEDDIMDGCLKNFDAVYFAGEWADHRAVAKLDAWVNEGGVLFADAGCGARNQFDEADERMAQLLGLKASPASKDHYVIRPLLELPLAKPIDTLTLAGEAIPAIAMKQVLTPAGAKVLGTWSDGSPAATVNAHGKGKAFAVGTLAGVSYMKTALKVIPYARGGRHTVYNPVDFAPAATKLARLGIDAASVPRDVVCSNPLVEPVVIDSPAGTLVTLVNWTNAPIKGLTVTVKMPAAPKAAKSVQRQQDLPVKFAEGAATFSVDLDEADYVVLTR
ncbi:MAG: hypothetical protein NTW19_20460 [Planctomycetota bacterium]|nr:hypothetical protein [Planctomycetota bacterium]